MCRLKLIVGLGNPGREFSDSRHNVGFKCIDHMAGQWGIALTERRKKAVLGQGYFRPSGLQGPASRLSIPLVLAKPRTFMNHSGEGVEYLLTRFSAKPYDLVIIYDDMDLPMGRIRIRPEGSAGGHNGIKSIIATLSTQEFPRVRVGIGKPPAGLEGMDYVLGSFSPEEKPVVEKAVATVAEVVACLLQGGIQTAMNRFN